METPDFQYIAESIKCYRGSRGLSMDQFAKLSGVSPSMICQIEAGKTMPSIQVLWRLSKAMEVPLSKLVDPTERPKVYRTGSCSLGEKKVSKDGAFKSCHITAGSSNRNVEIYAFSFTKKGKYVCEHASPGHGPRSTEYIILEKGELTLRVGQEEVNLKEGDALEFKGNEPHAYIQSGTKYAKGKIIIHFGS